MLLLLPHILLGAFFPGSECLNVLDSGVHSLGVSPPSSPFLEQQQTQQREDGGGGGNVSGLTCYHCSSLSDGVDCENLNESSSRAPKTRTCVGSKVYCKVRRMEYHISDEFENSSASVRWSMERDCAYETCKNFCVSMGARTRLTYCTSCCDSDLCNVDSGVGRRALPAWGWSLTSLWIMRWKGIF
eukprot:TRINITY_DN7198_c0_g1_i3.p1 TRINITY_DN7198_c0_g1~~TRINITY_DN7198_c0_g1_i3.p1  ORF type:complete len:186 (-),score=51.77 TRINITY_DN7198_c0_g1_i3:8-565(-)